MSLTQCFEENNFVLGADEVGLIFESNTDKKM